MLGVSRNLTFATNKTKTTNWSTISSIERVAEGAGTGNQLCINCSGNMFGMSNPYANGAGTQRGQVQFYKLNESGTGYTQIGATIFGNVDNQRFGSSLACNYYGSRVCIGAWEAGSGNGLLRVYRLDPATQTWSQLGADITASPLLATSIGYSAALNRKGDMLVVGAPDWSYGSSTFRSNGQVRVYKLNETNSTWTQYGASLSAEYDWYGVKFGESVAINDEGNIIAVGAGGSSGSLRSFVNVFFWNSFLNKWDRGYTSSINSEGYGKKVVLNDRGDLLLIGHPKYEIPRPGTTSLRIGAVYALSGSYDSFYRKYNYGDRGSFEVYGSSVTPPNYYSGVWDIRLGSNIAIDESGSTILLGDPDAPSSQYSSVGQVVTYKKREKGVFPLSTYWKIGAKTLVGDSYLDLVGKSVAISKNGYYAVVSGGLSAGSNNRQVTTLVLSTLKTNVQRQTISSTNYNKLNWTGFNPTTVTKAFGYAAAINGNGNIIAFGDPEANTEKGEVSVYEYIGTKWTLLTAVQVPGNLKLIGAVNTDNYGSSVALSLDGNTIAIGATQNDAGGASSGHVRVFQRKFDLGQFNDQTHGYWSKLGADIYIPNTAGAKWGQCIKMNSNGTVFAIGGTLDDEGGTNAGVVRVYSYYGASVGWIQYGQTYGGRIYGLPSNQIGDAFAMDDTGSLIAVGIDNQKNAYTSGVVEIYQFRNDLGGITGAQGYTLISKLSGNVGFQDQFGYSVSLNLSGNILAVGAPNNSTGVTLYSPGYVRVYKNTGTVDSPIWTQLGKDIYGKEIGDRFGINIDLNGSGDKIAIYATPAKTNKKHYVEVYKLIEDRWVQIINPVELRETTGTLTYLGALKQPRLAFAKNSNRVVVGCPVNTANALSGGGTVFEFTDP